MTSWFFFSFNSGPKPSLARQSTLYDEQESNNSAEAAYSQGYTNYQQQPGHQQQQQRQSYPIGNVDQSDEQYNYSTAAGYDDYSTYQQYDGGGSGTSEYDYNYDYNYGYSEGQQNYNESGVAVIDDGKESHGYGYYDETGYYYDGQWYSYDGNYDANYDANYSTEDATSNWSQQNYDGQQQQNHYDYSNDYTAPAVKPNHVAELPAKTAPPQKQPPQKSSSITAPAAAIMKTILEDAGPLKPLQFLGDIFSKRSTMMHHGDLSSSGGSVESEQPMTRRRESIASVTTPTGQELPSNYGGMTSESPLMMGELDRLQTDMLTSRGQEDQQLMNDYGRSGSGPTIEPLDHRRGSIQSRLSQMSQQSRRERAEHFRRRRSSSICSERDRDREHVSPYTSYEDERTPVNEMNLSLDMNDMTPIATQVPFPSQSQYKSVSFEEEDMYLDEMGGMQQSTDQLDQLPPPTTPPQDSVISAPPAPIARPCQNLTPRQKWLWAFNKICAQLMASAPHFNSSINSISFILFIFRADVMTFRLDHHPSVIVHSINPWGGNDSRWYNMSTRFDGQNVYNDVAIQNQNSLIHWPLCLSLRV